MKCCDPERMTAAERIAEVGDILAAGIQRLFSYEGKAIPSAQNSQDHLDVIGQVEASCGSTMELPA